MTKLVINTVSALAVFALLISATPALAHGHEAHYDEGQDVWSSICTGTVSQHSNIVHSFMSSLEAFAGMAWHDKRIQRDDKQAIITLTKHIVRSMERILDEVGNYNNSILGDFDDQAELHPDYEHMYFTETEGGMPVMLAVNEFLSQITSIRHILQDSIKGDWEPQVYVDEIIETVEAAKFNFDKNISPAIAEIFGPIYF